MSEMLEQNQGEFLLFSPRQDALVWARISVLAIGNTYKAETQHQAHSKNTSKPFLPDQ